MIILILQLTAMLATGLVCRRVARRVGLPRLVGELAAGLMLGPTLLGAVAPRAYAVLFPASPSVASERDAIVKFGLLLFLFVVGTQVNLLQIRRLGVRIVWTSLGGILLPFALGVACVLAFPAVWHMPTHGNRWLLGLFMGTALSISALPVIAKILSDLGMLNSDVGMVVMSAATLDDLAGWSLFAVILASLRGGGVGTVMVSTVAVLVLFGAVLTVGRRIAAALLRVITSVSAAASIGLCLLLILATDRLGLGAIFGAFLAGVAFAPMKDGLSPGEADVRSRIAFLANEIFAPLYFVSVGLQANFAHNFEYPLVLITILIACLGKIVGATAGARLGGASIRQALAIGFGLNARGAMGIILASAALEHGIILPSVFVAIVTMSLVTSVISGPAMTRLVRGDCVVSAESHLP